MWVAADPVGAAWVGLEAWAGGLGSDMARVCVQNGRYYIYLPRKFEIIKIKSKSSARSCRGYPLKTEIGAGHIVRGFRNSAPWTMDKDKSPYETSTGMAPKAQRPTSGLSNA